MVNVRTYSLWQQLAVAEELPDEALPTVIEVLCTPSRTFHSFDSRGEEWRKSAIADALPTLLRRTTEPALRRRLLEQADDKLLADLAVQGVVTAVDVPAILGTHRPTPGLVIGLARHLGQVDDAIGLLPHLHDTDLERVVNEWDPRRYRPDAEPIPPTPSALLDAVLEHALIPLARLLQNPGLHGEWEIYEHSELGLPIEFGNGAPWRILATCPERWPGLVEHPTLGSAIQHLLLDHAEAEQRHKRQLASGGSYLACGTDDDPAEQPEPGPALDSSLLRACLPALCLPEMAGLPRPSVTARHRLSRIAERVRNNPGLLDLAAEQLHAAADACVRRGRLLIPPRKQKDNFRQTTITVAESLALLSANATYLARACGLLITLEQPTVVSVPPSARLARITEGTDLNSPVRLLENNYQHRRVATLTALAGNPRTPRAAVTEALRALHPLELTWISRQSDIADWLQTTATALAPDDDNEAVLRLLTDDELDHHPNPAAVLQSWLDAPESDGFWSNREVYRAVLNSRHHTLHHLRQLPADEVLTRNDPDLALPHLLALCGTRPEHWRALLTALDYGPTDEKISFGQLLDSIHDPALAPANTA